MYIFKITTRENWQKSQGQENLIIGEMDTDYIHFATEKQVEKVIEKFFNHQNPVILKVDTNKLRGTLVLEANRSGGDEYYHLYEGCIPMDSISEII